MTYPLRQSISLLSKLILTSSVLLLCLPLQAVTQLKLPFLLDSTSEIVALQFDVTVEDANAELGSAEVVGSAASHRINTAAIDPLTTRYIIHDPENGVLSEGDLLEVSLDVIPPANLADLNLTISNAIFANAAATQSFARIVTPPVLQLQSPGIGRGYPLERDVVLSVDAGDADGFLQQVEFFIDGSKVAEAGSSPYEAFWSSPATGTYTIKMVATDNEGLTTESEDIPILIFSFSELSDYDAFKLAFFSEDPGNPDLVDPDVDPDGDGLANFLEFFLGLDPLQADAEGGPLFTMTEEEGKKYLVLLFTRLTAPQALNFAVQASGNMADWVDAANVQTDTTDHGDGTATVEIRVPINDEALASQFLRLQVSDE